MSYKVLAVRGSDGYLVECEGEYRFARLTTGRYTAAKEADAFLKVGYFEDPGEIPDDVDRKLTAILEDAGNRLEL